MNILITGSTGFLGKNLKEELYNIKRGKDIRYKIDDLAIMECNSSTDDKKIEDYCSKADIVYHFAGVSRPQNVEDFRKVNVGFTQKIIKYLKKNMIKCKFIFASSIQATLEGRFEGSEYGISKRDAEQLLQEYAEVTNSEVFIYRFPGIFGKWNKPNYCSVVATFCHNIAHDLPIKVNDASTVIELAYIDDVLEELMLYLNRDECEKKNAKVFWKYCKISESYFVSVGELADLINNFKRLRKELMIPDMGNSFIKKMWKTYLSYLPEDQLLYSLEMNISSKEKNTEIISELGAGHVFVRTYKAFITGGQNWNKSRCEKIIVVLGKGVVQLRKIGKNELGDAYPIIEYHVTGEYFEAIDIPVGYVYCVINEGSTDLVTIIWVS